MIGKILKILLLLTFLSACRHQLPQKVVLKFKDEDVVINLILRESNRFGTVYFGIIKIANLSGSEIKLPAWENKIFLRGDREVSYPIFLDHGYLGNKIASDFISLIEPNEFFEHEIFIQTDKNFDFRSSQIAIDRN